MCLVCSITAAIVIAVFIYVYNIELVRRFSV